MEKTLETELTEIRPKVLATALKWVLMVSMTVCYSNLIAMYAQASASARAW